MTEPLTLVAVLDVTDMEAFLAEYVGPLQPINTRHGVEGIAISPQAETIEGDAPGTVAILRFPSRAAFDAWYADPDYQSLLRRRQELTNADRSMILVLP